MTTITLEIPDELAPQITALRGRLPDLLARALRMERPVREYSAGAGQFYPPLYREIIDFLASDPAPEQVAAFKISPLAQERLDDLLDKNREGRLTPAETAEIDAYLQARDLMILLKADAQPSVW